MSNVIPAEAVEAAMQAFLHESVKRKEDLGAQPIAVLAALEAAAPHMLAGAWDEGWDTFAGFDSRPGGPYPANPYRPTP